MLSNKKLRNGFVFFMIILILIIIGELIARLVFGFGDPPLSISHPTIEYMFKPNQDVLRFHNRFITNQYGMRSEHFSKNKTNPNEFRVMVFGDSVVNGGNLTDHEKLATTLLQNQLKSCLKKMVIVGNISAGSWGPENYLAYSNEYGFFDADAIVLVISSHDYADNPTFEPLNPNTHPIEKPAFALLEAMTRYLPRYLPLVSNKKSDNIEPAANSKHSADAISKGLSSLKQFLYAAKKTGAPVYVLQHWTKTELERGNPDEGNSMISGVCAEVGVPCIQMNNLFQDNIRKGNSPFRDDIHPNDIGQELMTRAIWQSLDPKCI